MKKLTREQLKKLMGGGFIEDEPFGEPDTTCWKQEGNNIIIGTCKSVTTKLGITLKYCSVSGGIGC